MGTPEFAVAPLRRLVEMGYNVVAVVTMPDKPAGRGLQMRQSAVKEYALAAGLPVLQPEKLRDPDFIAALEALKPDLGIVIAFRMLPESVWSLPRLGTFNLHASLLPQYRGAAPINRAIMNGETVTGVTTFMLNHEIDKGDVVARAEVPIEPQDNAGTLHDKLMNVGCDLVVETVEKIASGSAVPIPQIEIPAGELRDAPKIFKDDCRINWNRGGHEIINLIRGLSPFPAAWSTVEKDGEQPVQVKIYEADFVPDTHHDVPGTISSDGKTFLRVACADGRATIARLQLAGKKNLTTEEFLRGFQKIAEYKFT